MVWNTLIERFISLFQYLFVIIGLGTKETVSIRTESKEAKDEKSETRETTETTDSTQQLVSQVDYYPSISVTREFTVVLSEFFDEFASIDTLQFPVLELDTTVGSVGIFKNEIRSIMWNTSLANLETYPLPFALTGRNWKFKTFHQERTIICAIAKALVPLVECGALCYRGVIIKRLDLAYGLTNRSKSVTVIQEAGMITKAELAKVVDDPKRLADLLLSVKQWKGDNDEETRKNDESLKENKGNKGQNENASNQKKSRSSHVSLKELVVPVEEMAITDILRSKKLLVKPMFAADGSIRLWNGVNIKLDLDYICYLRLTLENEQIITLNPLGNNLNLDTLEPLVVSFTPIKIIDQENVRSYIDADLNQPTRTRMDEFINYCYYRWRYWIPSGIECILPTPT